jgi:hypothetical protein
MKIELTNFAQRHFTKSFKGTKIRESDKKEFLEKINSTFNSLSENSIDKHFPLSQKNMPFCRYLVINNDFNVKSSVAKLTNENYIYLRSSYSSRNDNELPVLSRWLELPINNNLSKYITVITYSREQLLKEHMATNTNEEFELSLDCLWGIVSIMATEKAEPDPMPPITMMRNALGIEEGGNGVPLDKEEYKRSVDFWNKYVIIK